MKDTWEFRKKSEVAGGEERGVTPMTTGNERAPRGWNRRVSSGRETLRRRRHRIGLNVTNALVLVLIHLCISYSFVQQNSRTHVGARTRIVP